MKLHLSTPKIKLRFGLTINLILLLVILAEVYFVYDILYKSLNPQPTAIVVTKIVKVDLKAYEDTTNLLQSMESYSPPALDLINPNPFKYSK